MKILRYLLYLALVLALLGAGGAYGVYRWATKDLPNFTNLADYRPPVVSTVYAVDGRPLGYFYKEKRWLVGLDQMSRYLPMAFLAAEDSSFYDHEGVDLMAIARAFVINLKSGSIKQGGSTITQQIVKQLLLTNERSYERKIKEALLAYRLEHYLGKEEILAIYLNQIFLGAGAYGVEAAARTYFGKHVGELTLAECAVLAGLPQAPSRYNPFINPHAARERQKYVLGEMLELGWITREDHDAALAEKLEFKSMPDPSWSVGAYYLEEVRRTLLAEFGEQAVYEGGLVVHTACDLKHQAAAEAALRAGLVASAKRRGWGGPIEHLESAGYAALLKGAARPVEEFTPGTWVKALVTKVGQSGAQVLVGATGEGATEQNILATEPGSEVDEDAVRAFMASGAQRLDRLYPARFAEAMLTWAMNGRSTGKVTAVHGQMGVEGMGWCRTPNPKVAPEGAARITDARKVLHPGDVVWAAVAEAPEKPGGTWKLDLETEPKVEGALVSLDPRDGRVLALVGGYDYKLSQFNRATQARRQPGSSFKPIVYSAAIDNGLTAASVVMDAPIVFENVAEGTLWRPENYENEFYGPTLLRTALVRSRNLVTIRVAQRIGIRTIIERAKALGLEADFPPDLSVSLGSVSVAPINLCQAYTAFARDGSIMPPRLILDVQDFWGKTLYESKPEPRPAISPQTAFIMATLLKDVVQYGTGQRAKVLGRPVGGKTGTSNDERDAWFMGFSPYLLTGVFVGFDEPKPMGRFETGSRAACPIWVDYRMKVEEDYPVEDFPQPPGVSMVRVDANTGELAGPGTTESLFLPFKTGTEPTRMAASPGDEGGGTGAEDDLFKQGF
ncbi:MAG: penicillin-binding protein 1A [Desulfovibrionaceae bacterium]